MKKHVITSESVTEGHPDKIADQISDAILDNILAQDPESRVAIECLITTGSVHIAGEVTTKSFFDAQRIARQTLHEIGYTDPRFGIDYEDCGVWTSIHGQSRDISQGVNEGSGEDKEQGAGDQGCLKKGTLVRTKKGFIPIEEIKSKDFVITPFGLKKVLNSKKTGVRSIIEIECINGMRLGCTPEHRIFCYNKNGENYWKEAKKLSNNDYVCILKYSDYFLNKYFTSLVPKKSFFTKYNHKIYGPEELIFDEELGYITGLLIGDGHVKKRNTMSICFGKEKKFAKEVHKILEKRFPKQWKKIKNSDEIICLKIDSVLVRKHFENFGLGFNGSPKKITPNKIFISPKKVIKHYLRGLFDSDGTIVKKTGRTKNNIKIRLGSSSLKLLQETQLLLNDFSIKSSILFNAPKGKEVGKDKRYKSNYDSYVLSLVGFESYQNFAKEIGFFNPRKNERLINFTKKHTIKPRNSRSIFLIPHLQKNEMIGEEKIEKNFSFSITKIKNKTKKGVHEVYDLEIEEVNMFSGNGIFVHNSMYGYACNETEEYMPLPIILAHKLTQRLAVVRKTNIIRGLGPDGKSQVSVEYEDEKPKRIIAVVIAQQHIEDISEEFLKREILEKVIRPICREYMNDETKVYINATGRFVIGGPEGDTGVTGRKIIADTYGGIGRHGGGCFSGKDPSKVDRSASYAARHVAKNIVAAGLADKCEVQLSYAIGISKPTSINIDCFGTNKIQEEKIQRLVYDNFNLTPKGIVNSLNLKRPIYKKTASYGHFGRNDPDFTWEKLDKVNILKQSLQSEPKSHLVTSETPDSFSSSSDSSDFKKDDNFMHY